MHRATPPRLFIRGIGLVSPLGRSAWETLAAVLAGRTLPDRAAALPRDIAPAELVRAVGGCPVARQSDDDPAVALAEAAAREALFEARVDPTDLPCFLGTSKGAVTALAATATQAAAGQSLRQPEVLGLGPHGLLTHHLRRRLGLGPTWHHVAACASSLYALHAARQWLLPRPGRACLVVTAESAMLPLFIHSYRRLGVLAPTGQGPSAYRSCPLDEARGGFMLSELAAAIVLEHPAADARVSSSSPMSSTGQAVELLDTAVANETFDLIRPDPTMPALQRVAGQLLGNRSVDLIHAHAPGTMEHDQTELAIYARLCQRASPAVYASKGALGHGLGAAGLVSLVLAVLIGRSRRVPPMPWLTRPLTASLPLHADGAAIRPAATQAVFASGFGGHVAGAAIQC